MALETLKGVHKINDCNVIHMDSLRESFPDLFNEDGGMDWKIFEEKIRPHNFIYVRHDKNSLSFTLQNGPINEYGRNGCQVDEIIEAAKLIIKGLNDKYPCIENVKAYTALCEANMWLGNRKLNRKMRGVEGYNAK